LHGFGQNGENNDAFTDKQDRATQECDPSGLAGLVEGIETLGDACFKGNEYVQTVYIPDTVLKIVYHN
jgi:hypothetical protein